MHKIVDDQKTWQKALQWLKQHEDSSSRRKLLNECWILLSLLQWNTRIYLPGGAGPVTNFAQLLGDKMISGDVVDMMMGHLAERIEVDEDTSRTYRITTLSFQDHISKAWDSRKSNRLRYEPPNFLRQIITEMKKTPKTLLFPVHMKIKHYLGFAIDFKERLLCLGKQDPIYATSNRYSLEPDFTGDSLEIEQQHPEIRLAYKQIQWWLEENFQGPFEDLGGTIEHGIQRDSTSCAFTTANMFAHKALDEPLWNVSQKDSERVLWFNRLVKQQISVRISSYLVYRSKTHL